MKVEVDIISTKDELPAYGERVMFYFKREAPTWNDWFMGARVSTDQDGENWKSVEHGVVPGEPSHFFRLPPKPNK